MEDEDFTHIWERLNDYYNIQEKTKRLHGVLKSQGIDPEDAINANHHEVLNYVRCKDKRNRMRSGLEGLARKLGQCPSESVKAPQEYLIGFLVGYSTGKLNRELGI